MTKRNNRKYGLSRRVGQSVWGDAKDPVLTKNYPSGQHGRMASGRRRTGYGEQLLAKQLLRGYYGNITERQFRKIYHEAVRRKGDTSQNLIGLLESRLDSVVYRAKFVPTVFAARQFVNHKHIKVNGRTVNIASYVLKPGDTIEIVDSSKELATVLAAQQGNTRSVPEYIQAVDGSASTVRYVRVPEFSEVPYPAEIKPNLVIEYYSRV